MSAGILLGTPILFSQRSGGTVNLAAGSPAVTGITPVANGGTGTATGSITGTTALTFTAGGTNQNATISGSGTGVFTSPSVTTLTATSAASSNAGTTGALRIPNGGISCAGNSYFGGLYVSNSGTMNFGANATLYAGDGGDKLRITNQGFSTASTMLLFSLATSAAPALKRNGAVLETKLADDSGFTAHKASYYQASTFTVGTLPAAATAGAGARAFVTDALTPAFGSPVSAGGAVSVPVYSTGSAWNVG